MDKINILVVDDETDICDIIHFNLTAAGYEVCTAHSAEEAEEMEVGHFHLILLDVMMPGISGFEWARKLKQDAATSRTPIIFLTAKDTEDDKLKGFSIGADDYIAKPFSIKELIARVRAVLGRTTHPHGADNPKTLTYQGLCLDLTRKTVTVDGEEVLLTRTEFSLLYLLLNECGQVFSREQIIEHVWPKDVIVSNRTIDVNITRMRKKIGPYAALIATRTGFGYYFKT